MSLTLPGARAECVQPSWQGQSRVLCPRGHPPASVRHPAPPPPPPLSESHIPRPSPGLEGTRSTTTQSKEQAQDDPSIGFDPPAAPLHDSRESVPPTHTYGIPPPVALTPKQTRGPGRGGGGPEWPLGCHFLSVYFFPPCLFAEEAR